jgi:hypothetical protein
MHRLQRHTKENLPTLTKQTGWKKSESLNANTIIPDISYAATLKSQQHRYETATPQTHQQTTYQQQTQLPPSDIQELKVVMKGLMEQMGTMLSLHKTLPSKMA